MENVKHNGVKLGLYDTQWMNCVNDQQVLAWDTSKEDAVSRAVELAEKYCIENAKKAIAAAELAQHHFASPSAEHLYTMVTSRFQSGSFPWSMVSESGKSAWACAAAELVFAPDTIMAGHAHQRIKQQAERECGCGWRGSAGNCVWLGEVGPLCPECRETTEMAHKATVQSCTFTGSVEIGVRVGSQQHQAEFSVVFGPFNVAFMGAGVWAGIADELPTELVGKQVWVSTNNPAQRQAEPVAWKPGKRPPSVFKTSEAGRQYVADFFANALRRHDFSSYIKGNLAADFACALADGLHAMQKAQQSHNGELMACDVLNNDLPDAVIEATADAIGEAYDCVRVWEAWSVGTMGPDDFRQVADDSDRVAEIARAAIIAWHGHATQPPAVAVPDGYALVPIDPTDDMCAAAWDSEGTDYVGEHHRIVRFDIAYKAAIAVAQKGRQ